MMKFSIRDLVIATSVVAVIAAFAKLLLPLLLLVILVAHLMLVVLPVVIVFGSILFATQRGTYLDIEKPMYQWCKWLWLLSLGCVGTSWFCSFVYLVLI